MMGYEQNVGKSCGSPEKFAICMKKKIDLIITKYYFYKKTCTVLCKLQIKRNIRSPKSCHFDLFSFYFFFLFFFSLFFFVLFCFGLVFVLVLITNHLNLNNYKT